MKIDLKKIYPDICQDGLEWYNKQPDERAAWENCPRGDWMLWIAYKLRVPDRVLTLTKGHCANTVRHLMKDKRSRDAVDAAIAYGEGKITREELNNFSDDAMAAYIDADFAANDAISINSTDAYIIDASASAANAAFEVINTENNVIDAIHVAVVTAEATDVAAGNVAAGEVDRIKNQQKTADICRKYLTNAVMKRLDILKGDNNGNT